METRPVSASPSPTGSLATREDSDLLVKDLQSASRGRGASPRRFDTYDEPPPAGDAGFHPEIEKRVRRLQVDQPLAAPRTVRGASYAAIGELHSRGYEPEDIARHLGLGLAEVRTYLQIERSPMLD